MLGAALDRLRSETIAVLHDRLIPGTKANIDHLAIGPAGVFVIDAKHYGGKVERRGFFGRDGRHHRLFVAGRDRTERLLNGMDLQVSAVHAVLNDAPPVIPVVCFVNAQWGLLASPLRFGDVRVLWPRKLYKLLNTHGGLTPADILRLEGELAVALPPA
jgi:hypothetical protein